MFFLNKFCYIFFFFFLFFFVYFFFIFFIGLFTYKNSNKLNFLNLYLILLSIILEILHVFIPLRGFELSDLF